MTDTRSSARRHSAARTVKGLCVLAVFAAILVLIGHRRADATSMRRMAMEELIQYSQKIVRGTVTRIDVAADKSGHLWSLYTIAVTAVAKGQLTDSRELSFRCAGGRSMSSVHHVPGTPLPSVGSEGLFFYAPDNEVCQIMGWQQGLFPVVQSPSGRKLVVNHEGRPIISMSVRGAVMGRRPEWLSRDVTSDLLLSGPITDVVAGAGSDVGAAAEPDDVVRDLMALAEYHGDRSPPDSPSAGTVGVVGTRSARAAVAPLEAPGGAP